MEVYFGILRNNVFAMLPLTELRGVIPIGTEMDLNLRDVYIASVIGSTIVLYRLFLLLDIC